MLSAKQIEKLSPANIFKNPKDKLQLISGQSLKGLSAFQILLLSLLEANGDMEQIPKKFRGPLRCSVKETQPNFLLTDGSYYISGYFTEKSYKQFRDENSSLRVTDLQDIMVQINKWHLELSGSATTQSFTQYAGIEMKMIIHQMDIKKDYRVELQKFPTNLYRDDKMKTAIQIFLNSTQRQIIAENQKKKDNQNFLINQFNICVNDKLKSESLLPVQNSQQNYGCMYLTDKPITLKQMFNLYKFQIKQQQKIYPLKEIVETEKGKIGVQQLQKMKNDLIRSDISLQRKADGTAIKLEEPDNLVVEKTLKLKKEKGAEITTTFKKQIPRSKKSLKSETLSRAQSKISVATIQKSSKTIKKVEKFKSDKKQRKSSPVKSVKSLKSIKSASKSK